MNQIYSMKRISNMVFIQSKHIFGSNCKLLLTGIDSMWLLVMCDWSDKE